ncbi:MAG TPA: hypothetical protein VF704_04410 [Allosphingosinicella sp.]
MGEILRLHGAIGGELKRRDVSRTGNNPCADFAEYLFCRTFGWHQNPNSKAGYDATDDQGLRYEIKARRISRAGGSRQVSALRRLAARPFDRLAGVVFDADYRVLLALDIPYEVVVARSVHIEHTNSGRFFLRDDLKSEPGVRDLTAQVTRAAAHILSGHA